MSGRIIRLIPIAVALVEAREKAGITQTELARRVGLTQGTISEYEAGIGEPRLERLPALARALGCVFVVGPEGWAAVTTATDARKAFTTTRGAP